jgi:hypothetical protein
MCECQVFGLADNGLTHRRVGMTQTGHSRTARCVKIPFTGIVDQKTAITACRKRQV